MTASVSISSVSVVNSITTRETLTSIASTGAVVTSNSFNPTPTTLGPTATATLPAVTKYVAEAVAQASGGGAKTASIDLTACNGTTGVVDLTGLKVQMMRLTAAAANTGIVTIQPAASNGYAIFGAANDLDIPAGGSITVTFGLDKLADVAAGARLIELVGTSLDTYTLELWAG